MELLFPRKCCVCGESLEPTEQFICAGCMSDFPFTYFWNWRENPAEEVFWGRCYIEKVISLYYYSRDNDYSHLVRRIKYGSNIALGRYLGEMLGRFGREILSDVEFIVPVPVHPVRLFTRGYNQSKIIAEGISKGLGGLPVVTSALKRVRYSKSQTSISMESKWENVKGSFSLGKGEQLELLKGKHILLVDDVLTSGATLEVCASILIGKLGCKVSIATLAYVE